MAPIRPPPTLSTSARCREPTIPLKRGGRFSVPGITSPRLPPAPMAMYCSVWYSTSRRKGAGMLASSQPAPCRQRAPGTRPPSLSYAGLNAHAPVLLSRWQTAVSLLHAVVAGWDDAGDCMRPCDDNGATWSKSAASSDAGRSAAHEPALLCVRGEEWQARVGRGWRLRPSR